MAILGATDLVTKRQKAALGSVPVLALLTATIALGMLILWLTANQERQLQWPHVFLMKSNTALCLLLLALSLVAHWTERSVFTWAAVVCACMVIVFAAAILTEYVVPIDLGIDQWIATDYSVDRLPGRTSVAMAVALLMMATAYTLLSSSRDSILAQAILLAALIIPVTTVGGYLYRAPDLAPLYRASVVSLQSTICTLLLCVGGFCLRPGSGLLRIILSESAAGTVARRLLAAAIIMPATIGVTILYAEHVGLVDNAVGFATLMTSSALFFAAAVWIVSGIMLGTENAKAKAESTLDVAERRLHVGEQRLRIALEAARLGTWEYLVESEGLITSAQCKAIYGVNVSDPFTYPDFVSSIVPEHRERVQASAQQSLSSLSDYKEQYEVRWPDGTLHWVLAYGRPLIDESGKTRMVGVSLDVTESVQSRAALELADRRKDEFLATLAHELRNPLAPIRQAVTVARSDAMSRAQHSWALNVIDRQASHMAVLLDDLLDVSRITRGQLTLQKDWVDINSVVEAAMETAQPAIGAKGQRVQLHLAHDSGPVFVDPVRTAQMLSNLLINAAKYSGPGTDISLRVAVEGPALELRVQDQGMGIAADMLEKIFEMFTQVEVDRTRSGGGLGIGLALVRGLAELHGGTVTASSDGLDKGSEFLISLPHVARPAIPVPLVSSAPSTSKRRILAADDNTDALETLKLLLEMEGHEVVTAFNGEAALALAEQTMPEVMLLDLGMPGLNGLELATRIRKRPWADSVVLIAITGWGQAEDRKRSLSAGFDHHLTKPIDFQQLRALLSPGLFKSLS